MGGNEGLRPARKAGVGVKGHGTEDGAHRRAGGRGGRLRERGDEARATFLPATAERLLSLLRGRAVVLVPSMEMWRSLD